MTVFAAIYTYDDDRAAERAELLAAHRSWLADLKEKGSLYEAGITVGGPGAILVFEFDSVGEATAALDADPFYSAGLVHDRTIAEWKVGWGVVAEAATERRRAAAPEGRS